MLCRAPLSQVMRRLLTGYAVSFNRRHRRFGHLFQNRYTSILCEEDPYVLELVRYIHLNPVRAGLVAGLTSLGGFLTLQKNGGSNASWECAVDGKRVRNFLVNCAEPANGRRRQEVSYNCMISIVLHGVRGHMRDIDACFAGVTYHCTRLAKCQYVKHVVLGPPCPSTRS